MVWTYPRELPGDRMRRVVFTDLDGTFIDFETYSPGPALAAAANFMAGGDILVFCSSKTMLEQVAMMEKYQLRVPAIVENGSGLYLPPDCYWFPKQGITTMDGGRLIGWGIGSNEIQQILDQVEEECLIDLGRYRNFSTEELALITGLDIEGAERACHRDFSETLTAKLDERTLQKLNRWFEPYGLHAICGGRFHTVTSVHCDKGKALSKVFDEIRKNSSAQWVSVAIGDSANDFPMLSAAQQAFLVKQHQGGWARNAHPEWIKISAAGPEGFVAAMG